jgi:hypothetical protein
MSHRTFQISCLHAPRLPHSSPIVQAERGYATAIIMKQISPAEALHELDSWGKASLVGCVFSRRDTQAAFRLRRANLALRGSHVLLSNEPAMTMFHFWDDVDFALFERNDLAVPFFRTKHPFRCLHSCRLRQW